MNSTIPRLVAAIIIAGLAGCATDSPTAPGTREVVQAAIASDPVTRTVTSASDAGPGSLRQTIFEAVPGDVIGFAPEVTTILLTSTAIYVGKPLTIQGPATRVTLDGQNLRRLLLTVPGGALTLRHLVLTHGNALADDGGAIRAGASLVLEDVILTANTARYGGAVVSASSLTATDCQFTDNTASDVGGAIFLTGAMTISNSRFTGNTAAGSGGAIYAGSSTSDMTIDGSTFEQNAGAARGGAVTADFVTLRVSGSTFRGNSTATSGGAIHARSTQLAVVNSTIFGNGATVSGGGVYGDADSDVLLEHVTVAGNSAPFGSGINFEKYSNTRLRNTLFSANTPLDGTCGTSSHLIMREGNNRSDAPDCAAPSRMIIGPTTLGALSDNGGPTFTMSLPVGSAAIDAGLDCSVPTDQRGIIRPQGATCDLGAFEFNDFTRATVGIDPSGTVSISSGTAYVSGTVSCSRATTLALQVRGVQSRKVGRVNTTIEASTTLTIACGPTLRAWAAALTPATGAFGASPMTVTADASASDASVVPSSVSLSGVKMSWTKR